MSAVTWNERMAGIEKRRIHREQRERERAEELAAARETAAVAERARIVAKLKGIRDSYRWTQGAERNAIEMAQNLIELT